MFVDRRPRVGRLLEWKVGLFSVAAVLTVGGFYLNERWMIGAAILVLTVAMLLRFLPGGGVVEEEDDDAAGRTRPGRDREGSHREHS